MIARRFSTPVWLPIAVWDRAAPGPTGSHLLKAEAEEIDVCSAIRPLRGEL